MIFVLDKQPSIARKFIAELRDIDLQKNRPRFRANLERIGHLLAYELSKNLVYTPTKVDTPLGTAATELPTQDIVIGTILRAGLPIHHGCLTYFEHAESTFISAHRKHHKSGQFHIEIAHISSPNLEDKVLILTDAMLATGASVVLSLQRLLEYGTPAQIHVVAAIAAEEGIEAVQQHFPEADIWVGAMDAELTARAYIVPGLGDAGDLAFGQKL
ncbi:MAG: uracil phosphoribosyltransferase [Bacteroidota bacterium]